MPTIDLTFEKQITFTSDDRVYFYLINNNDQVEPLKLDNRNFHYNFESVSWRTNPTPIINSPGAITLGDSEIDIRRKIFTWTIIGDPLNQISVRNEMERFPAFFDRNNGPFWLYDNQTQRITEVERVSYQPSPAGEGVEGIQTLVSLELLLKNAYWEDAVFIEEINSINSDFEESVGEGSDLTYNIYVPGNNPVRLILNLTAAGVPTDLTVRNETNNRAFRYQDNNFIQGVIATFDSVSNRIFLTIDAIEIESSVNLITGGHLELSPGYNTIRITSNSGVAVPDFYYRGRYAY